MRSEDMAAAVTQARADLVAKGYPQASVSLAVNTFSFADKPWVLNVSLVNISRDRGPTILWARSADDAVATLHEFVRNTINLHLEAQMLDATLGMDLLYPKKQVAA